MKIHKGTLVTHTWLTGNNSELEKGVVTEECEDANIFMVRVKFQDDKRSRWENREELTIHRSNLRDGFERSKKVDIEEMLFIGTIEFEHTLFPEDRQKFQLALKQAGYILYQDEETGEYEIYERD